MLLEVSRASAAVGLTEEVYSGEVGGGDSCDPTHDDDETVVMNGPPGVIRPSFE